MSERVGLISGVTAQDGAYLAELLLSESCTVHGIKRRSSFSIPVGLIISIKINTMRRDKNVLLLLACAKVALVL